jgi:hypothetical protein
MTMTRGGRRTNLDYTRWLKRSFGAGVFAFVIGLVVLKFGPQVFGPLPGWEHTLLWDLSIVGLLVAFFSPFVFGVVLPLLE